MDKDSISLQPIKTSLHQPSLSPSLCQSNCLQRWLYEPPGQGCPESTQICFLGPFQAQHPGHIKPTLFKAPFEPSDASLMTADPRDLVHLKVLCPDSQMRSPSPSFTASCHLSVPTDNSSFQRTHQLPLSLAPAKAVQGSGLISKEG